MYIYIYMYIHIIHIIYIYMISAQWFGIVTHCCVKFSENTEEDL
jgi:hypothetical protein